MSAGPAERCRTLGYTTRRHFKMRLTGHGGMPVDDIRRFRRHKQQSIEARMYEEAIC